MGSHKPPIENPSQATRADSAPVNSPQAVTRPPTTITPVSNDDLHPLPSSFTTNAMHPSLQSKLVRHIPKGARNCTGQLLTNIINRLLLDPMHPEHWRCLFCFAALTLAKPQHGGKRHNLTSTVKKRSVEFMNTWSTKAETIFSETQQPN